MYIKKGNDNSIKQMEDIQSTNLQTTNQDIDEEKMLEQFYEERQSFFEESLNNKSIRTNQSNKNKQKPLLNKPLNFDSYSNPEMETETIVLPCEKDDTDTVFAVKEALRRGFEDFLLIGVVGERLDHTLGNVSILLMLDSEGKEGTIIDDYSEMEIVSDRCEMPCIIDDSYVYFSLINISGTARGVTIRGAKYPLENAEITCEYQYGVSNEVLPGCTAEVSVGEGRLLLVKVR